MSGQSQIPRIVRQEANVDLLNSGELEAKLDDFLHEGSQEVKNFS